MKGNLVGKVFSDLTVIEYAYTKNHRTYWKCKCKCGNETIILRSNLVKTKSCGCRITTNKYAGNIEESVRQAYYNMKKRCNSVNNKSYKNYGARGITICGRWHTLEGFLDDMLESYIEGYTLDRIDVNKGYNKENCRWVTKKKQANNKTNTSWIEYEGEKYSLAEFCEKFNYDQRLIGRRLRNNQSLEEAINTDSDIRERITYNGVSKPVVEFAQEYGMTYEQLKKRLMRGWSIERALTQPLRKRNN